MKVFKVFLSHCTKDKEFVQKLAEKMLADQIEPWLCEIDVLYGDDFVEQIERGLGEADLTLLIWSPDAARSAWTGIEWRSVLARETEESRKRLGLILLHDAEIPQLLRTKHRIDAQTDQEKAIQETTQWLVRHRDMRQFEQSGAARFIVDYEPSDFVGRGSYLEELHEAMVEEQGKYLLWGGPGSGKSTLALKFAWKAQGAFDAVVFQHCGQRTKEEIGVELAERIGLDIKELPPERQIAEAKKWVCGRRTLLVLDDIWNLDVQDLIPGTPLSVASLSILCTSRQRSLPWVKRPRTREVLSFAEEETEALFRLWLEEETVTRHRDDLLALARRVEHLPIAVAVAAEMMSRQFGPLDKETTALELERLRNEVHDVPDLLQRAIESQSAPNQQLLNAMAVCHAEGLWFPLAATISGLNDIEANQARDQLVNASLVQVVDQGRQRFRLHALLREQLLRSLTTGELQTSYLQALEELFADWETRWKECGECLTEVVPALQILYAQDSMDRIAWLAYYGFVAGQRIGELQMALHILRQEEAFWKDRESSEAEDSLSRSYGNQALILQAWGQLEDAMALHKKEEALCEALGNKDSLQRSYGNQALILKDWGQLEDAMALHKKEEALCEALGNKDGLQACYGNQALILQAWGQLEDAMALHKKEEALCEALGNKDSLQRSYGNQALILQAWGQLEDAMALHKKEEALCEALGNKEGLQACYGNQALILQAWGQLEDAMALHKKEEALCEALGNKDSLQRSYGNQALILQAWGQLEDAMALHKKQEALCEALGNKDSLQRSYGNQALILKAWGQLDEAMALHKKEEALCEALGNKEGLQACYGNQALILQAWGQLEAAMALLKEKEALCKALGKKSSLGYCYWSWGLLARELNDRKTELEKLNEALRIFTDLNMPQERDAVKKELEDME